MCSEKPQKADAVKAKNAKNPLVENGELNALMGKVKKKAELAKEPSQSLL